VPEFGMGCTERPMKSVQRDSGLDMKILCDIDVIIEIDEVIVIHLPENGKRSQYQNDINDQTLVFWTDIYLI
jgi:hypothetical protein